jgi:hypothetical protein
MSGEQQPIFEGEEAMMETLKGMGMPPDMLLNLTPEQKTQMFQMTQQQDIVQRAMKLANVNHQTTPTELKEAANGLYSWSDRGEHVYMEIPCYNSADEDERKKNVSCKIEATSIWVGRTTATSTADDDDDTPKQTILQGTLFQTVIPTESKWELRNDGVLQVTMKKVSPMRWLMCTNS